MDEIATLSQVDIRKVWPGEASHFAPWLAESADLLGEALGMDLAHEHTEAKVGRYSADLVFREASTGKLVVVENMFSTTVFSGPSNEQIRRVLAKRFHI
ncbi:MAG: hypothetical protein OXD35_15275, partial [Thiotrichales bacterium]|nr:hypothetical protein [Thiotrichales bacterium]